MRLTERKLKKMVMEEIKNYLAEMEGDEVFDSKYFRDHLDYFIESDWTTDEQAGYLKELKSLIRQMYPDGDITKEDIFDLTRDYRMSDDVVEKVDYYTLINQIWEQI